MERKRDIRAVFRTIRKTSGKIDETSRRTDLSVFCLSKRAAPPYYKLSLLILGGEWYIDLREHKGRLGKVFCRDNGVCFLYPDFWKFCRALEPVLPQRPRGVNTEDEGGDADDDYYDDADEEEDA